MHQIKVPRGIYLNLQVGNNDFSSFNNSTTCYIAPVNKFGKFDFTAYTPSTNVTGDAVTMGETGDSYANPFTGVGLASTHPFDINENNIIPSGEEYGLGKVKYNGVELGTNYFGYRQYTVFGSVFDAYYQGDKISISTNPAPFPWLTYQRPTSNYYSTPQPTDNRKIYLNGLSIRIVEQRPNGDVKISIRWKDYDVKNNVRWCGDIVLNEEVNLQSGNTILLDQGLTPVRPNNPIFFNGQKVFADPTIFTCKQGSQMNLASNSKIVAKDKSSIILENGANVTLQDKSEIIVESGSTLIIKSGANLTLLGEAKITIQQGGYICVESGANILLQDLASIICLKEGAILGVNPALFSTSSCLSAIPFTGNGSVIDFSQDVYIQNETITSNRYIGGRNIYVGHHVTNSKPHGDVLITNNAQVIFDAAENVIFDTGFTCTLGATFEVKK